MTLIVAYEFTLFTEVLIFKIKSCLGRVHTVMTRVTPPLEVRPNSLLSLRNSPASISHVAGSNLPIQIYVFQFRAVACARRKTGATGSFEPARRLKTPVPEFSSLSFACIGRTLPPVSLRFLAPSRSSATSTHPSSMSLPLTTTASPVAAVARVTAAPEPGARHCGHHQSPSGTQERGGVRQPRW